MTNKRRYHDVLFKLHLCYLFIVFFQICIITDVGISKSNSGRIEKNIYIVLHGAKWGYRTMRYSEAASEYKINNLCYLSCL